MADLVWFTEAHPNSKFDKQVFVNVENITCAVASDEAEDETIIYFNSEDCLRVRGTLEETAKVLEHIED